MLLDHSQVDAVEQPVQLLDCECDGLGSRRPGKAIGFKSLEEQPEAVAASAEYLDAIAAPVAEYEQSRSHRVQVHRLLNQDRQAVDTHAEVDRLAMQVHFQPFVEPEHGNLPSIWTIVSSSSTDV